MNTTSRPSAKFDVAPMPLVSRYHAVNFHVSPAETMMKPAGVGCIVLSIRSEISPAPPEF